MKYVVTCGTVLEACLAAEAIIFAATWDIFTEITAIKCSTLFYFPIEEPTDKMMYRLNHRSLVDVVA